LACSLIVSRSNEEDQLHLHHELWPQQLKMSVFRRFSVDRAVVA
jgi:hypothetical protein